MSEFSWNLLVGVTDYNEGADLSTHLISYGWNSDHCYSAEAVMDTLSEGSYSLVILDDEILADSEWSLEDLADSLPGDTRAIIIGEPGSVYPLEAFGDKVRVVIRPFSYNLLHSLVEILLSDTSISNQGSNEEDWTDEDSDWRMSFEEFKEYVTV